MEMRGRFIEPMLLLRTEKLPDGADWVRELSKRPRITGASQGPIREIGP
jgi:hypothetical protein